MLKSPVMLCGMLGQLKEDWILNLRQSLLKDCAFIYTSVEFNLLPV